MKRHRQKQKKSGSFLRGQQTKAAFLHLFGTHRISLVILGSLTAIALSWFGDGLWKSSSFFLHNFVSTSHANSPLPGIMARLIVFPVTIVIWILLFRQSIQAVANLTVHEYVHPPGCKVLVMFLSPPGNDQKIIKKLIGDKNTSHQKSLILDIALRNTFSYSWRMPLESIAWHLQQKKLERVVIVPSATVQTEKGPKEGTYKYFTTFRRLIEKISAGVSVHHAGEANSDRWMQGVDYESARALRDCLKDIINFLVEKEKYLDEDIIIDITSGQKLPSSVGTLLSLEAGRQIQYVSTHDYKVKSYNISYGES